MRDLSPEERASLKAYKGEISSDVIKADLQVIIGSPVSGTINANDVIELRIGDKIVYRAICK